MKNIGVKIKIAMAAIAFTLIAAQFVYIPQYSKTSMADASENYKYQANSTLEKNTNTTKPDPIPLPFIKLPIVMYHHVEIVKNSRDYNRKKLGITPQAFEKQLKLFTENGYVSYFVKDIPKLLSGEIIPARKKIVLTFDDGYKDFYTNALPLLKKYNVKATIYIISNYIGKDDYLTAFELQEIVKTKLIEIGAHTLDHKSLKSIKEDEIKKQILESKKNLEKEFGLPIETFAYPYGDYNQKVMQIAKDSEFIAAVAIDRVSALTQDNLFNLPRLRSGILTEPNALKILESYEK